MPAALRDLPECSARTHYTAKKDAWADSRAPSGGENG